MTSFDQQNDQKHNQKKRESRYSANYFNRAESVFAFCFVCFFGLVFLPVCPTSRLAAQTQSAALRIPISVLKKCWENEIITKNIFTASDNQSVIYLLTENNKIQSINSADGKVNWVFEIGGTGMSKSFVSDTHLYVAGSSEAFEINANITNNDGNTENSQNKHRVKQIFLRSVGAVSGIPEWSAKTDSKDKIVSEGSEESEKKIYLGQNENGIFLLDSGGNLFFANKNKGSIEWSRKFDSAVREFFDFNDENRNRNMSHKIFAFYGTDKNLYLVKSETGKILNSIPHAYIITAAALLSPSELIFGDEKGNISLINVGNNNKPNAVWTVKIGAGVSSLSLTTEGLLITSLDNFVYLINPIKGNRIWKKRLSGRLVYKPLIIESEKIFIAVENESAYFISMENGAIVNRITLAADEYFINTPVSLDRLYIFTTNSGTVAYSGSRCT